MTYEPVWYSSNHHMQTFAKLTKHLEKPLLYCRKNFGSAHDDPGPDLVELDDSYYNDRRPEQYNDDRYSYSYRKRQRFERYRRNYERDDDRSRRQDSDRYGRMENYNHGLEGKAKYAPRYELKGHNYLICWITLPADLKNWTPPKRIQRFIGEQQSSSSHLHLLKSILLSTERET